ncbi:MAG: response regulator transcription factor [Candidatus Obscuribacterales bacterium]|jgi:DNA-binding NarL/FixJ family response regulator|nr:response regulator transcription factor [Candidatus Obscuribacterales bacterium]
MTSENNKITVLSVENTESDLLAVRSFLEQVPGLILVEATNGADALQQLKDAAVDVALIDVGSPNENVQLTKLIRQAHPSVRVIIFTSADTPEDIFTAMDAGADGYVLKGIFTKALETALRSVRLGAVWLDPGIATQVLKVIETAHTSRPSRTLPTGLLTIPLMPEEKSLLHDVAGGECKDGVCMVDPSFIKKLRRFAPAS